MEVAIPVSLVMPPTAIILRLLIILQFNFGTFISGKGLSIKDVRSQRDLSSADKWFFSNANVALFSEKDFEFFEIYDMFARTRGLSQCDI